MYRFTVYGVVVFIFVGSALLSGIMLALATYQSIYPLTLFAPALLFLLQVRVRIQTSAETIYMCTYNAISNNQSKAP